MADTLIWYSAVFLAVSSQMNSKTEAACPPSNGDMTSVTEYVAINETLYNRTYSNLNSGNHPLGFYSNVWHYNQNLPNPCIKITAPQASLRMLEIQVETIPEARICVKDQISQVQCFQGRGKRCGETPGNTVYVEFLCESGSGCEEADVNFWYRLVLSPLPSELVTPDTWCFNRHVQYPTDLLQLPDGVTPMQRVTPHPKDPSTAGRVAVSATCLVAAMVLLALLV